MHQIPSSHWECLQHRVTAVRPHLSGWRFQQLWNGSAQSFAHSRGRSEGSLNLEKRFETRRELKRGKKRGEREREEMTSSWHSEVMALWSSLLASMSWPAPQTSEASHGEACDRS